MGFACVHLNAPRGYRVNSGSLVFTRARLGVAGFIPFRIGSLGGTKWSPGSFGFPLVYSAHWCRRIHSEFTRARSFVIAWVHLGTHI